MSADARAYQKQIVGGHEGEAYRAGTVKFDGFKDGVLLDAKGPRYAHFIKDGQFQDWFTGAEDFVGQAQRQIEAAKGYPIRWCFAEEEPADLVRKMLNRKRFKIEVVHIPFAQ
jgi:hypothetical protein